ncbi:MAG: hypothetical protein R3A11_05030 [Bdellovibrionota bacterium]
MKQFVIFAIFGALILSSMGLYADETDPVASLCSEQDKNTKDEKAVTKPKPVDMQLVTTKILGLKNLAGKSILTDGPALREILSNTFDPQKTRTKMEQFYTMLYVIASHMDKPSGVVQLEQSSVREVLMASTVFTDETIPNQISGIELDFRNRNRTQYSISFDKPKVKILLNQGRGFTIFRNGKCQHAQSLIFERTFSFDLKKLSNGNLLVKDFSGVNLFGDFGNRGIVDVDINYVALKSVEFYHGTELGKVTAFISDEEFEVNDHSGLLKLISKLVPDRSVQPIDW